MSLLERIDEDLKTALKAHDMLKATVLRGLKSDIKYKQIDKGAALSDDEIVAVLNTACKRRRDSIEHFGAGNRPDLVEKESAELAMIIAYLPEQLPENQLRALIAESIAATGADSPAKTGLVMKDLMPKVKGRADGKLVSRLVGEMLTGEKK
ncbi:conserved hypothetical protein [Candidatus Zixiibacteriota bacterium]|nr:conserved hypothetical protein [candidate division Zixibacteria bacterium]